MAEFDSQEVNKRVVDGFVIVREDPFGFWNVSAIEGPTPLEFKNQRFTDTSSAHAAIKGYAHKRALSEAKKVRQKV